MEWKAIPGYEGYYEVSDTGLVRSVYRYKKILKPMISKSGYQRVDLFKNKVRTQYSVHRLVALVFVPNPTQKPIVNHKDENKMNNNALNLEWVTHVENCRYGTAIQRRVIHTDYSKRRVNNANQIKAVSIPIAQYSLDGRYIRDWPSASACARENGWVSSNIRECCLGKRQTAYGYIFKEVSKQ